MARRTRRAGRALAQLSETDPSLAALALWCDMTDGTEADTYTAGDTIWIGTEFVDLPLREQMGLLGHHVLHIAFRHEARALSMQARVGGFFNETLFNLCADALLNSCLLAAEHAVPRPAVTLADLLHHLPPAPIPRSADLTTWDVEKLYFALSDTKDGTSDGVKNYMQEKQFARDLFADSTHQPSSEKAAEWQTHLRRALQSSGAAGRGIGSVLARLSDVEVPTTPWEVHLRGLLARAVLPDHRLTYKRPRAAWIAAETHARHTGQPQPAFEPAIARWRDHPRIVVGVDTSGSIARQTLQLFAGEILGVARRTSAEIHILCFDDTVYAAHKTTSTDAGNTLENIDFRREGGTSFDDLFAKTDALNASVLVVLTDLAAPIPSPPETQVIWAVYGAARITPAFGKVVDIRG